MLITNKLDRAELHAIADALTQYVDNNDPEECDATSSEIERWEAARRMRDAVDAVFAKLGEDTRTR